MQQIQIPEVTEGETYVGIAFKDGRPSHHVVLLPGEREDINWPDAKHWAESLGGELPTRKEQALLFANAPEQFKDDWYWSVELTERGWAWCQHFFNGHQYYLSQNDEFRARAVRRLPL